MNQSTKPHCITRLLACVLSFAGVLKANAAVTAEQLSQWQASGVKFRLIDVRPQHRYERGTIPGAMNIPASVLLEKKLPPLGKVVIFCDGFGEVDAAALAGGLNTRGGFNADFLEGGFSAWKQLSGAPTTAKSGLRPEDSQYVTYDQITAMKEAVVMLDLRKPQLAEPAADQVSGTATSKVAKPTETKEDDLKSFCSPSGREYCVDINELRRRFHGTPGRAQMQSAKSLASPVNRQIGSTPLIVLVDAGDGSAEKELRRLKVEGFERVVVLAGGEKTIQLQGRRGKGRMVGAVNSGIADPPAKPKGGTDD
jgi:rhodanese-related sulfurtransferase